MTVPTTADIARLYSKRAKRYNFTANLYYLIGFREQAYREMAVERLSLKRGDTVVEIGCGTGMNFPLLQRAVGTQGKIIGVDLTDAMLAQAHKRVADNGWSNVELIQCDAAFFRFPSGVDGIISTFALTLVPEFDRVISNGAQVLPPGRRWVVLDFKIPSNLLAWLAPLGIFITSPFGVTRDLASRHPRESIDRYLTKVSFEELYAGFAYIVTGER